MIVTIKIHVKWSHEIYVNNTKNKSYLPTADEQKDQMRKEMVELKRNMNDEIHEKDAVTKTAEELRGVVKKNETDKIELNRALADTRQRATGRKSLWGKDCNWNEEKGFSDYLYILY